jgi:hypothetical protein
MPGTYFGPFNEQYSDYAAASAGSTGRFPLGHTLILPDGREYRFALNDATVEVAGNLYQSVAPVADHTEVVVSTTPAAGDTTLAATLSTTPAAADIYSEGIAHTNKDTGLGYAYRIERARSSGAAHAAVLSSGVITVNLAAGEKVQVAGSGSTEISLTRNRFHSILIHASPPTAGLAGVSPGVAAANRYYWSQVKGEAAVLADGTLLVGNQAQASITTDGAIESYKRRVRTGGTTVIFLSNTALWGAPLSDQDGSAVGVYAIASVVSAAAAATYDITGGIAYNAPIVGVCRKVNVTTEYALVDLNIT